MASTPVIRISIDGEDQFARAFDRYDAQFDDLSNIWPDVRDEFWSIEKQQFRSEGVAGGDKWKPLSPAYAKAKLRRYGAKPILQATGDLYASLTGETGDTFYQTTKTSIEIGTTLPYARYHQHGTDKMPARPPIRFSKQQQENLSKVIQKALIRELRRGSGYLIPQDR